MLNKDFDIVVYGATSFVGKIVCDYLVNTHVEPNLSWAMAARSEQKLLELKTSLGDQAADVPILIADSADEESLHSLCSKAEVIISTVGPYALYGDLLVKVCAITGTDYCDLTGEAQWIKRMIEAHEAEAQQSGARIVHSCGFDSIPSDMGVQFLQRLSKKKFGEYSSHVKMRVKGISGGASGGTIASGLNLYAEMAKDPGLREEMADSYSLCGENHGFTQVQHIVSSEYDADFNSWSGPFVMAAINTRIVLRSNAIATEPYSASFRYDEGVLTGSGGKGKKSAKKSARNTGVLLSVMSISPIRWFAGRFLVPQPGQGPTAKQQLEGYYDLRFIGITSKGEKLAVKVTGDRDPGYGSTAKMLAQAAISLRRDVDKNDVAGGFWTPATVFDERFIQRLESHAGMSFESIKI